MNNSLDLKFKIKLDDDKKLSGFLRSSDKELKKLETNVNKFGKTSKDSFSKANAGTGKFSQSISGLSANFKTFAGAALLAAPALAAFKFTKMVQDVTDSGDALQKLSIRIGASTEALSQYQLVADLSGVSFNTLALGFQRMTRRVSEAANGTGEAVKALDELGLSAKLLEKLAPERQFEVIAEKISQLKNQSDKVRVSMKLFDTEGVALLQTMEKGAQGISEMRREADRLGITLSRSAANDMAKAKDEITRLKFAFDGIALSLTSSVIPSITTFLEAINSIGKTTAKQEINELGLEILDLQKNLRDYYRDVDKQGAKNSLGFDPDVAKQKIIDFQKTRKKLLDEINQSSSDGLSVADGSTGKKSSINSEQKKSLNFATKQANLAEASIKRLQREIALREDGSAKGAIQYDITFGSLKSISALQKQQLLILAGEKDAIKLAAEEYEEYNEIVAEGVRLAKQQQDDSASDASRLRERFKPDLVALEGGLADALDARDIGIINDEELNKIVTKMGRDYNDSFIDPALKGTDKLSAFADEAARNMEGAFADFLFDPFENGLDGMLEGFTKMLARMAAEYAASEIFDLFKSKENGGSGITDAILGALVGAVSSSGTASVNHGGGIAGSSGIQRTVNPAMFANAPRFHNRGFPGLKSDEVPIIAQKGERILSKQEVANSTSGGIQISTNVTVSGGNGDNNKKLGKMINSTIKQVLVQEKRPGGLLA